jgi:hypothetical protein
MGIEKGTHFQARAWDHERRQVFRKFYGQQEEATPIPHSNRLYNEALTDGEEINAMRYATGKPSK